MRLYHTGYEEIREPDIHHGRKNADYLSEADVVVGPIANDTIFDTFGIITSGFLRSDEAIRLLLIGPKYEQTVIKSPRAAANLRWISSREISGEEIARYRGIVEMEEMEYQKLFAKVMEEM